MPFFDPQILAADCGGSWLGLPAVPVSGFAIDTRRLEGGEIFVALRTEKRDGHKFVGSAAEHGASAALVSRDEPGGRIARLLVVDTLAAIQAIARAHRRRFTGRVIGVTGSAGKTSTKDLLAGLLAEPGGVLATEGNLNNHLGVPLTLLRIDPGRHACAVVEAGINSPGEMNVLGSIMKPDIALITTVAAAHLERLGTIERVGEEKACLAAHLAPSGVAVFPAECLAYPAFRNLCRGSLVAVPNDAGVCDLPTGAVPVSYAVTHDARSTSLVLSWGGAIELFEFRRLTPGMARNAVLAIIAALHVGVAAGDIRVRLDRWQPAPLRGEVIRDGKRLVYLDCYNANPASMVDALDGFLALAPAKAARLFVVGCMEELGAESASLHRAVGARWPLRDHDRVIVFGTQAEALAEGIHAVRPDAAVIVNPDRAIAESFIRDARGAIFVKGSRAYRLETLVQPFGGGGHHHERESAA